MSAEERRVESVLLKERRSLISNGTSRKLIKIRGNRLFVSNQLSGQVINEKFVPISQDHSTQPNTAANPSSTNPNLNHDNSTSPSTSADTPNANSNSNSNQLVHSHDFPLIGLWNCRSIKNKLSFFQSLIYAKSFDVFCITESWLSDSIYNEEVLPHGYVIYRRDRPGPTRGGGVFIAVSQRISSKLIFISPTIEMIAIELILHRHMIICCIYIPPQSSENYITDVIESLHQLPPNLQLIILGDFNFPEIEWETLNSSSSSGSLLCDHLFSLNLIQLIDEPTHIQGNILDVIITNQPDQISNLTVDKSSSCSKSDHYLITFNVNAGGRLPSSKPLPKNAFIYSKADMSGLLFHLWNADIDKPIEDINGAWCHLKYIILNACHKFIPCAKLSNSSPKWFNSDIRHKLNCIHSLRRQIKLNSTP